MYLCLVREMDLKKCLKNFANPLSDGYATRKNIPIKNTNF